MGDFLEKRLTPYRYTVQSDKPNKTIKPNVCEYSTSKSDCLIWHSNSTSVAEGLNVQFVDNYDIDYPELWQVTGEAIELKSDEPDESC